MEVIPWRRLSPPRHCCVALPAYKYRNTKKYVSIIVSISFHVIILSYFSHQIFIYCWCADKLSTFDLSAGKCNLGCRQHHVTISILSTILCHNVCFLSYFLHYGVVQHKANHETLYHFTTVFRRFVNLGSYV